MNEADVDISVPGTSGAEKCGRVRNPENWKRKIASLKRARGEEYVTQKGIIMPAKTITIGPLCQCRLKCSDAVSIDARESLLKEYYSLNVNSKNAFLFKCITPEPIKRRKQNPIIDRSVSFKYYVFVNDVKEIVCKAAFCEIFKIGRKKITILQKQLVNGNPVPNQDMQGKHFNRPHKLTDEVHHAIVKHINSFPYKCYDSNRKYLSPLLSVKKMYLLYIETCSDKPQHFKIKESTYRHIFCTEFNLAFGEPKTQK